MTVIKTSSKTYLVLVSSQAVLQARCMHHLSWETGVRGGGSKVTADARALLFRSLRFIYFFE